jgi:hypothetical protein
MTCGTLDWKYQLVEFGDGCPDVFLSPGMVLGVATTLLYLAWLLRFPT